MHRSLVKTSLVALALLASMASPARADAAVDPRLCARAHVAGIGWQGWDCQRVSENTAWVQVGTTGQNRAMEAIEVQAYGFDICVRAHMRNIGWGGQQCTSSTNLVARAGTTGKGIPLEALAFTLLSDDGTSNTARRITGGGHVQNIGWQRWPAKSRNLTTGTVGKALNLEAVQLVLY